jgi:hypothetical protein
MQKQLNPELFKTEIRTENKNLGFEQPSHIPVIKQVSITGQSGQSFQSDERYARPESKFTEMIKENSQLKLQVQDLTTKFMEYQKINQTRFERYNQAITQLQENMQVLVGDWTQKIGNLQNKLTDRKNMDTKMQETIDRHNTILKAFELRLGQMQKIITEKDEQIKEFQSLLNDTKMELSRIKRFDGGTY